MGERVVEWGLLSVTAERGRRKQREKVMTGKRKEGGRERPKKKKRKQTDWIAEESGGRLGIGRGGGG